MCGCFDNCLGVLVICVLSFIVFLYCLFYVFLLFKRRVKSHLYVADSRIILEGISILRMFFEKPEYFEN